MEKKEYEERLSFWEDRYPGKGAMLMEVVGPFYDWKPKLRPALPDLNVLARRAIFWDTLTGLKVLSISSGYRSLDPFPHSLGYEGILTKSLSEALMISFGYRVRESLDSMLIKLTEFAPDPLFVPLLRIQVWDSFRATMHNSCGLVLLDRPEKAADYMTLRDLFRSGNFPVGIDGYYRGEGSFVILVAD